ncbi:MAG: hypothetical protein P8Y03_20530, partial [Anaerolineales bacterium]
IARDIGTALLWASHWSVVSEPVEIAVHRTQCIDGPTTESAIPPKVVVEEEAQNKEATGCRKSKAISREMAQRPGMVMTQVS